MILFQGMSTRRYGTRGPVILNDRHKQTSVRGPAPQNPTAPRVIRVSYLSYGSSASTQPQYMEFIPTSRFPKQWCLFKLCFWTCLNYAFWTCLIYVIWLYNDLWTSNVWLMMVFSTIKVSVFLLFTLFSKYMHQWSHWYMLW